MLQVQVQSRDSCNTVTECEKVMVFIRQTSRRRRYLLRGDVPLHLFSTGALESRLCMRSFDLYFYHVVCLRSNAIMVELTNTDEKRFRYLRGRLIAQCCHLIPQHDRPPHLQYLPNARHAYRQSIGHTDPRTVVSVST